MAVYAIETLTNLHVGDMGAGFSVVDKTVQRDVLTGYPTIYATSLKGALRSAAEKTLDGTNVNKIFGGEGQNISKGTVSFNDARILFYPVRSLDRAYYLATCPGMLKDCAHLLRLCGNEAKAEMLEKIASHGVNVICAEKDDGKTVLAEEWFVKKQKWNENAQNDFKAFVNGEDKLVILADEKMGELMANLHVVARNMLENGISKNLWYEELVPRKTVFITGMIGEDELEKVLKAPIQIGANATVGYGLCQFKAL